MNLLELKKLNIQRNGYNVLFVCLNHSETEDIQIQSKVIFDNANNIACVISTQTALKSGAIFDIQPAFSNSYSAYLNFDFDIKSLINNSTGKLVNQRNWKVKLDVHNTTINTSKSLGLSCNDKEKVTLQNEIRTATIVLVKADEKGWINDKLDVTINKSNATHHSFNTDDISNVIPASQFINELSTLFKGYDIDNFILNTIIDTLNTNLISGNTSDILTDYCHIGLYRFAYLEDWDHVSLDTLDDESLEMLNYYEITRN